MCILFIYRDPSADTGSYRLIIAANRDEFYNRPATSAHWWEKHPMCLGGLDMEPGREGGTWLALSSEGRAGIVLNRTGESKASNTKGRGYLITDYITSNEPMTSYLNRLHKINQDGQPYNPYNLVLLEFQDASINGLSSSDNSPGPQTFQDRVLGFGNSSFEHPFKKVEVGKEKFSNIVDNATVLEQDVLIKDLLHFLKSKERCLPDPELQRRAPNGFNELSSIFVDTGAAGYGTRTHSIILVDGANQVTFVEETLMPDQTWKLQSFKFPLKR
ncbi:transport and Golgi organization protein 2 [Orussus abietinus]|uniref:transport and Golgi organization protein 2 n=1 Tax=Orussus abietinus TaxID=222816 RepID=UPI00062542B8|nr:transport and Golgi organization protein 2 [Orussus abietinus]